MSEQELIDYWNKPFSVKPANGFYAWTKPQIVLRISDDTKGGLISEKFSLWLKSPKKGNSPEHSYYPSKKDVQESNLAPFFEISAKDQSKRILRLIHF